MEAANNPPLTPADYLRNVQAEESNKIVLSVFPDKVWERIFLLCKWKDVRSCRNTCKHFRELLFPLQPSFRFPEAFPHLYKYLTGGEILRDRTVCWAWADGIDDFLGNHKSQRPHDDKNCDARDPPFLTPMEEKGLHLVAERFVLFNPFRQGKVVIHNPLIGRAPEIDLTWDCAIVMRLLAKAGKYISYLTVHLEETRPDQLRFTFGMDYPPFHNFLVLRTPNLRKLRLIPTTHEPVFSDAPTRPNYPTLGPLEKFETFQYDGLGCGRNLTLFNVYHQQLKKIHVDALDWLLMYKLGWPSLVDLHLNRFCRHTWIFASLFEAEIPELRKFGCSNRKYDVGYHDHRGYYNYEGYRLDLTLETLEKLSETTKLNTFRLDERIPLKVYGDIQSADEIVTHAPKNIRTLHFEHYCDHKSITCYSFLLHFPLLENLNVYWKTFEDYVDDLMEHLPVNDVQMSDADCLAFPDTFLYKRGLQIYESELVQVNRYLYIGEMYQSNIWEVLPKLKVFTFQLTVYTREGYEEFKLKQLRKKLAKERKEKLEAEKLAAEKLAAEKLEAEQLAAELQKTL